MERFFLEGSEETPQIEFQEGNLLIEGRCFPENTFEFFSPVIEWLESYFRGDEVVETVFSFKFKYFNSATTQVIFQILDIIEESEEEVKERVFIKWYHDEENGGYEDYEDYSEEFPDLNIEAVSC